MKKGIISKSVFQDDFLSLFCVVANTQIAKDTGNLAWQILETEDMKSWGYLQSHCFDRSRELGNINRTCPVIAQLSAVCAAATLKGLRGWITLPSLQSFHSGPGTTGACKMLDRGDMGKSEKTNGSVRK